MINTSSKTNNFLYLILKIIILEEKLSIEDLNNKIDLIEFNYLFKNLNIENLYKIIKKQKLSVLISKSIFLKENMPTYFNRIIENNLVVAKKICFENMVLSCEIYKILKKENIDVIFFKGSTLSLQTTGSIFDRGPSRDIDFLVKEKSLIKTIEILKQHGFKKTFLHSCQEALRFRSLKQLGNHPPARGQIPERGVQGFFSQFS